jgi:hypothetical protein
MTDPQLIESAGDSTPQSPKYSDGDHILTHALIIIMNIQTFLLMLIAFMIGNHWYPDYVYPAVVVALMAPSLTHIMVILGQRSFF